MNQFKKKLFKQLLLMLGLLLVSSIATIVLITSGENAHSSSFMLGLSSSFLFIVLMMSFNYFKISRDPDKLKREMIKDSDERNILIQQKVQANSFTVFVVIIALITIVLAFYNIEIMYWMASLLWVAIIVKVLLYIYYKRKL